MVLVRGPRGTYIVLPLLPLKLPTPEIKSNHRSCHSYASPPQNRFFVGCSSPFVRLTRHLTALRAWCKQYLPGRHTTTAMHETERMSTIEYTPPVRSGTPVLNVEAGCNSSLKYLNRSAELLFPSRTPPALLATTSRRIRSGYSFPTSLPQ